MYTKLYFILGFVFCDCYFIQKCCDKNQQLNLNFDTCIDFNGTSGIEKYETYNTYSEEGINFIKMGISDKHHIWWLPPEIQFLSSSQSESGFEPLPVKDVKNIKFAFNQKNPCEESTQAIVPFSDHVFLLDNGSLLITGITDNVRPETMIFPSDKYCLDRVSLIESGEKKSSHTIDHSFVILLCPCLVLPCVRMCCPRKSYLNVSEAKEKCEYSSRISPTWNLSFADFDGNIISRGKGYGMVQGTTNCSKIKYLNDNSSNRFTDFWILPNGNVRIKEYFEDISFMNYCIHNSKINGNYITNLRFCERLSQGPVDLPDNTKQQLYVPRKIMPSNNDFILPEAISLNYSAVEPIHIEKKMLFWEDCQHLTENMKNTFQHILYATYYVTGAFFLGITLLIYILLPELRKTVYANSLISHIACLFVCYSLMAFNKIWKPSCFPLACKLTGYFISFSFISAMLWLNVMCFHIWKTLSQNNLLNSVTFNADKRLFLIYSVFVWGITASISLITFLADETLVFNEWMKPNIGVNVCWINGFLCQFTYFYLPVSIILFFNFILFLFTFKKIKKEQKQMGNVLNLHESNVHVGKVPATAFSARNVRYIKLFILMGVAWIFEVLSWVIKGNSVNWYFTDAINAFRGMFLFVICCCKRAVFLSLSKRLSVLNLRNKCNNIEMDQV